MIDAHSALRTFLIQPSPLRTLLNGDFVYWPELPGGVSGATKRVVFRFNGGLTSDGLRLQQARVNFRCYGESAFEAMRVYRALYDRLHDTQNFIVGDVGFHGVTEDVPGQPLQDPGTNWHYTFAVYTAWVATVPVSAAIAAS
jgi:hypothetical protein